MKQVWKTIQRWAGAVDDGVPGPKTAKAILSKAGLQMPDYLLVTGDGSLIRKIVLHCTATREGQEIDAATIRRWHKRKGWFDIGYHFVIGLDGNIERGRPENINGAHVEDHNTGSIGVVYVGGLDAQGKPKDTRTPAQLSAMARLVGELVAVYPEAKVMGHRDLSPDKDGDGVVERHEWLKDCPCFDAQLWWEGV